MAGVQPPPLRSLDDFLLCSARFAVPDVRDLDRWNHRMINNLLYYQTNYLLIMLCWGLVGYFQPFQMFVGVTVVSIAFVGFVFAAENQATVRRFRRNHPYVSVTAVLLATYLFMLALGGVAVFLFGIAFPVLTVCIHASVRLRSLKNKLENKLESIGLKRTPMGLLLEALGQEQEAGS
uniref:PRA1 family protein n=1 Tax=Oryzias latipes TaxID=8090 RepID=A0A3P9LBJ3_ORYLA